MNTRNFGIKLAALTAPMMLTASAFAAAPVASLSDTEPGILHEFSVDSSLAVTGDWGVYNSGLDVGTPTVAGGVLSLSGANPDRTGFNVTNKSSASAVGMGTSSDWVASFEYSHNGGTGSGSVVEYSAASGGDILRITGTGDANNFILFGGNGSGSYAQIGGVFSMSSSVSHDITIHYQSSSGFLDFYLDDALVADDFVSRSGNYDLNIAVIGGGSSSSINGVFDNLRVGVIAAPTIPEPATAGLLMASGAMLLNRRRSQR